MDLSTNKITSIPRWISNFKSLKTLNINGNRLTNLPEEIGNLVKLETLLISGNLLKNLPKSLGKLNQKCQIFFINKNGGLLVLTISWHLKERDKISRWQSLLLFNLFQIINWMNVHFIYNFFFYKFIDLLDLLKSKNHHASDLWLHSLTIVKILDIICTFRARADNDGDDDFLINKRWINKRCLLFCCSLYILDYITSTEPIMVCVLPALWSALPCII